MQRGLLLCIRYPSGREDEYRLPEAVIPAGAAVTCPSVEDVHGAEALKRIKHYNNDSITNAEQSTAGI